MLAILMQQTAALQASQLKTQGIQRKNARYTRKTEKDALRRGRTTRSGSSPPADNDIVREAKVKVEWPDKFDRADPSALEEFLARCDLAMDCNPWAYRKDNIKINAVGMQDVPEGNLR